MVLGCYGMIYVVSAWVLKTQGCRDRQGFGWKELSASVSLCLTFQRQNEFKFSWSENPVDRWLQVKYFKYQYLPDGLPLKVLSPEFFSLLTFCCSSARLFLGEPHCPRHDQASVCLDDLSSLVGIGGIGFWYDFLHVSRRVLLDLMCWVGFSSRAGNNKRTSLMPLLLTYALLGTPGFDSKLAAGQKAASTVSTALLLGGRFNIPIHLIQSFLNRKMRWRLN